VILIDLYLGLRNRLSKNDFKVIKLTLFEMLLIIILHSVERQSSLGYPHLSFDDLFSFFNTTSIWSIDLAFALAHFRVEDFTFYTSFRGCRSSLAKEVRMASMIQSQFYKVITIRTFISTTFPTMLTGLQGTMTRCRFHL
jgi:hypothetical protein